MALGTLLTHGLLCFTCRNIRLRQTNALMYCRSMAPTVRNVRVLSLIFCYIASCCLESLNDFLTVYKS